MYEVGSFKNLKLFDWSIRNKMEFFKWVHCRVLQISDEKTSILCVLRIVRVLSGIVFLKWVFLGRTLFHDKGNCSPLSYSANEM